MIAVTWVLCGLLLDIVGVLILAYGETAHHAAFARYARGDASQESSWNYELKKQPWWARPLIRVGAMLGSRDPEDMGDAGPLEGLATRLLGYIVIFLGFVLQGMGALVAVW